MNHTERIAETARQHRHLSRRLVKEAVETYLELLAGEIAEGEWVDIYGIGKIQVITEKRTGALAAKTTEGDNLELQASLKLRSKLRLSQTFKQLSWSKREF